MVWKKTTKYTKHTKQNHERAASSPKRMLSLLRQGGDFLCRRTQRLHVRISRVIGGQIELKSLRIFRMLVVLICLVETRVFGTGILPRSNEVITEI